MSHVTKLALQPNSATMNVVQKVQGVVTEITMAAPGPINNDVIRTPGGADAEFVTQAEYDGLGAGRPADTLYFITDS